MTGRFLDRNPGLSFVAEIGFSDCWLPDVRP
jgi:hypothetical protein